MLKKHLQYELWKNCEHNCKFCYNQGIKYNPKDKWKVLDKCVHDITCKTSYDTISFIGGELFGYEYDETKYELYHIARLLNEKFDSGQLKQLNLTASLIYENEYDNLIDLLDTLNQHIEHINILTSYDTIGRFKDLTEERNWFMNIQSLKIGYPTININCTTIITGDLIDKYLNNDFKFEYLTNLNNIDSIYLKLPQLPYMIKSKKEMNTKLPNFFPTKNQFIKFLEKIQTDNSELWNCLFNIEKRADTLIMVMPDGNLIKQKRNKENNIEFMSDKDYILPCGHQSIYAPFIDSDDCALCIKQIMGENNED